jgi:hypothetical protein
VVKTTTRIRAKLNDIRCGDIERMRDLMESPFWAQIN